MGAAKLKILYPLLDKNLATAWGISKWVAKTDWPLLPLKMMPGIVKSDVSRLIPFCYHEMMRL
jgi:hypothetical protein